jgi:hypothetical protein
MGLFDSIIDSISDAGHWLGQNAGSILQVANTIAGAAGTQLRVDADDDNLYSEVFHNLDAAKTSLANSMHNVLPTTESAFKTEDANTNSADICAVWPDPSQSSTGNPVQPFYADISKFMSMHQMDTVLDAPAGKPPIDLALLVAQKICETASPVTFLAGSGTILQPPPIEIGSSQDGTSILGQHLYYTIPIGLSGAKSAWHSYIRLNYTTTGPGRAASLARRKALALAPRDSPTTPYNSTTVLITWSSAVGAASIMAEAQTQIAAAVPPAPVYTIQDSFHSDLTYTYVVATAITIGPGGVQQIFSDTIMGILQNQNISGSTNPPAYPSVVIMQNSTVLS